jgi:serine/threonine protein kinase
MMVTSNVRLLRPLGEGGMGAVWLAEHLSLRTNVVVKFMAEDLAKSTEAKARFSREAAAASQVKSPHVVQMLDHGVLDDGAPYIVMELLEGRDLEQQLKASGHLEPREVVAIVAQLARALGRAHERAIVHRDIKPSNVFLCDAGGGELFVKLLDFGIAKGQEIGIAGSTTRTGSFIGSPYYMSPEQVVGAKDIDFRSDLWSRTRRSRGRSRSMRRRSARSRSRSIATRSRCHPRSTGRSARRSTSGSSRRARASRRAGSRRPRSWPRPSRWR